MLIVLSNVRIGRDGECYRVGTKLLMFGFLIIKKKFCTVVEIGMGPSFLCSFPRCSCAHPFSLKQQKRGLSCVRPLMVILKIFLLLNISQKLIASNQMFYLCYNNSIFNLTKPLELRDSDMFYPCVDSICTRVL